MKSIAVTKPDMGVLSQDRLILSPFGALSQAFGEELLARAQQTEGAWSYVPLELLEEGEEPVPPTPPVKPVLQVNLQLILDALRREGGQTERQRATERIVERILQRQAQPAASPKKEKALARTPAQTLSVLGTVHQEIHQNFNQSIRISAPPSLPRQSLGELARKAEHFSQRLQTLREEGAPPAQEVKLAQGNIVPLPAHSQAAAGQPRSSLPQQALTLLEEQGDEAAQTAVSARSAQLMRRADQLAHQMEQVLAESAKNASSLPASDGKHRGPETSKQPRRTTRRGDSPKNQPESERQASPAQGPSSPLAPSSESKPHSSAQPQTPQTAARDIRVSPDTPLGSTAVPHPLVQTEGQGVAAPMVPGQTPKAPAVSGQGVFPPTPLDLSLRTESEKEEVGKTFPKASPGVEKQGRAESRPSSAPVLASAPEGKPHPSTPPRTPQTAARDIRVSPDTPLSGTVVPRPLVQTEGQGVAAPMVPGQTPGAPAAPGQGVLAHTPLDLSLRTESEKEEAEKVSTIRPTAVEKQEGTPHSSTQPRRPQTAARNIRVSPDTPLVGTAIPHPLVQTEGQGVAAPMVPGQIPGAPAVSGQGVFPPAPLDLSLRTEVEKEEAGETSPKASSAVEKQGRAESRSSSSPGSASAPEGTPHPRTQPRTPQTAARDIRVSPDTPLNGTAIPHPLVHTQGQGAAAPMVPGQTPGAPAVSGQRVLPPTPLDLSLRTESEKEEAGETFPKVSSAVEKQGRAESRLSSSPGSVSAPEGTPHPSTPPRMPQTAARDIRVSPDTPLGGTAIQHPLAQTEGQGAAAPMVPGQTPGAPAVSRQGVLPPTPLDLSLRTESEQEEAGKTFPKAPSAVEKQGRAESRSSSSPISASALEGKSHPSTQSRTAQTAARDIRVSPDTPLGGTAIQQPLVQTEGQGAAAPMVPGQTPGAPAVFGQGGLAPAPLDLSLCTESEQEEARKVPTSHPSAVEKQEGTPRSSTQPRIVQKAVTGWQAAQIGTQDHPSIWAPHTAARDIRTQSGLGHAGLAGTGPEPWMAPSLPLTLNQPAQTGATPQAFSAGQTTTGARAAGAARQGASSMTEPLSLTYGPAQGAAASPPPEPETSEPAPGEESDFVRSLPDWARRFLKQSRSASPSQPMGVARDISTLPPAQQAEEVQWTAPNYRPPQATITHREKKQEEGLKAAQEVHISEAEIQRTADRVYRIIEDRIRLERRRLGL